VFCLGRIVHTTKDLCYLLIILLTLACSVACSSSLNKGHTSIYIVLIFLLLVHTTIKEF